MSWKIAESFMSEDMSLSCIHQKSHGCSYPLQKDSTFELVIFKGQRGGFFGLKLFCHYSSEKIELMFSGDLPTASLR
ncbi:hypothetical protein BMNI_I0536 [Brucella melitensis NI]|nr:hypothetical protein BMNI_I0536 [Brucella melitensis NI]